MGVGRGIGAGRRLERLTWGGGASLPAGRGKPRGSNTRTRVKVFKCKHTSILVDRVCTRGDFGEREEDEADDGGGASSCGGLPLLMGPVGSRLRDGRYKSRPTITGSLCVQS